MDTLSDLQKLENLSDQASEFIADNSGARLSDSGSDKLREYRERIGSGGTFTDEELLRFKRNGQLMVQAKLRAENSGNPTTQIRQTKIATNNGNKSTGEVAMLAEGAAVIA